ncbi:hypothetical protein CEXT_738391 [Caerostris extrusa]|uniref:Uncharacterized protein n=1 Tax=Caerostris extrusa TaxID=172846 RepID=A0AAV4VSB8_CAEEX|nr:hypothetical protein CEXT_738391 [Caerostris extrusa]
MVGTRESLPPHACQSLIRGVLRLLPHLRAKPDLRKEPVKVMAMKYLSLSFFFFPSLLTGSRRGKEMIFGCEKWRRNSKGKLRFGAKVCSVKS